MSEKMRFSTPRCPTCRELAKGTAEIVEAVAYLTFDDDGVTAEYEGYTEVLFDTAKTRQPPGSLRGRQIFLTCTQGHDWTSAVDRFGKPD